MRKQEGSEGCNAAHESRGIAGCARFTNGASAVSEGGSVAAGKRMGEVNDGQRRREICARASTKASVDGQGMCEE